MKPAPQVTPVIIERIQKLLALSASPNEHEAALALQRASDLLLKYNLSRADVEGREVSQAKVGETRVEIAGRITDWHRILMVHISDHCFCEKADDKKLIVADSHPWDWPEDAGHENGNYQNRCIYCQRLFIGHKRRVVCRICYYEAKP